MALMNTGRAVIAAALASILVAAPSIAQKVPSGAAKAASGGEGPGTDLIGRPVDLDLSKGVQPPFRDTSKLPTTFVEAAKTQPVNPKWGAVQYRPRNRRDLTGIWINQGGIGWTPGVPPGRGQNPPLTPAYRSEEHTS